MHLDDSILQTKTATNLIETLKLARTITKQGSNACKKINDQIESCVSQHSKAINKRRVGKKQANIIGTSSFNNIYKVNL